MSSLKQIKNNIKSKIETIKRINDSDRKTIDSFDSVFNDLPSIDAFGKKLSDLKEKRKRKKEQKQDIFSELIDVVDGFLGNKTIVDSVNKSTNKQKLKEITVESVKITINDSKNIVMDTVKEVLFAGDGICGSNKDITVNSLTLKPEEFDFMNVLTITPSSNSGKIIYENENNDIGLIKMNRQLYDTFTTSSSFDTKDGKTLFNLNWDVPNQRYNVSGLTGSTKIEEFLTNYYSNIEQLDISGVTKTAVLMTINGDGTETTLFNKGINDLNRLLKRATSSCGNPNSGLNQTTNTQFNENDEDESYFFDFEDVEGINLDDENLRYKKVLKFKDCNNFEIPVNNSHFEDFVYLSNITNIDDVVNSTLINVATDTKSQTDSIPLENLHLSLLNSFILNLPKALIGSVLSPKYLLPIVIVYKSLTSELNDVKVTMKKLYKLFSLIIKRIFWKFITEFWKKIKVELLNFLKKIATKIIKNKNKRYLLIVSSLISLIKKIIESNLDNCDNLYGLISKAIETAISAPGNKPPLPPFLLSFSSTSSGYSQDRALLGIIEKLNIAGVNTSPIYGEPNKLVDVIKSIVDGQIEEMDKNSYVTTGNVEAILPSPVGPIPIPRGLIKTNGKII